MPLVVALQSFLCYSDIARFQGRLGQQKYSLVRFRSRSDRALEVGKRLRKPPLAYQTLAFVEVAPRDKILFPVHQCDREEQKQERKRNFQPTGIRPMSNECGTAGAERFASRQKKIRFPIADATTYANGVVL